MSASLLDTAKAAIAALSIPSETHKANEWLVDFEKSSAAWEVSNHLIKEPIGSSCRFFGAKFLYSKVQRQYHQLDDVSVQGLTTALLQHIMNLSQEPKIELNLCRYLCLALAALTLQMNQSGIISQILGWFNPIIGTAPTILLELLIALPEEAYNRQVDVSSSTREQFIRQLSESSESVMVFLSSLWGSVTTSEAKCKILLCAERWIDITRTPAPVLQAQEIFRCILASLTVAETFEAAADCVIAIVRRFRCRELSILQAVVPAVVNLRDQWWTASLQQLHQEARTAAGGASTAAGAAAPAVVSLEDLDEDVVNVCRTLCRLFTEVAEACMDLFVTSTYAELPCGQSEILTQLLDCTRFPYDVSIARIPLRFFYELSLVVKNGRYPHSEEGEGDYGEGTSPQQQQQQQPQQGVDEYASNVLPHAVLQPRYASVFTSLLEVCCVRLRYPDLAVLTGATSVVPEEVQEVRQEWRDTVLDCCYCLGGEASLSLLCASLSSAVSSNDLLSFEAVLLCVQAIASFLPREEQQLIPGLVSVLTQQLPEGYPRLSVTAVELLGRFAFWIESNTAYLQPVLSVLFTHLEHPLTSLVAARSVMSIFRYCNRLPSMPVEALHALVLKMRQQHSAGHNTLEAEIYLLESLAVIISRLEVQQSEAAFRSIMMPLCESLSQLVSDQASAAAGGAATGVTPFIVRITIMFRFYHSEGNVTCELLSQLIPLYARVLQQHSSEGVCEKICSCYKHAIRNCSRKFISHLPLLTTHLTEHFARLPFAAFLYASSICLSTFGTAERGACVPLLYEMVWSLSGTFFAHFPSLAQFEQRPDVVEEYFFFMAKALQYCPAGFVQDAQRSGSVLGAAVAGLAIRHREAQKGILLFFEKLVQLATFWPESNPLQGQIRAAITSVGPQLVSALFTLLSGQMPAYAIDESNGSISDVLWNVKKRFEAEFRGWLVACLQGLPAEAQLIASRSNLLESVMSSSSQRDFSRVLDRYEMTCRRSL